jgi:GT2 family glycosyltransferase
MYSALKHPSVTVAIPTFGREGVLIETLDYILSASKRPDELIVVDQTQKHEPGTTRRLQTLITDRNIRLVTQRPSIPKAMNRALKEATGDLVLFVDDDIIPAPDLIAQHIAAHQREDVVAVVGQVLQPGEEPIELHHIASSQGLSSDLNFCFRSTVPATVQNVMAGNLSVNRRAAIAAGGFDENFVGVAYRFETEFARRLSRTQGPIRFEPSASIRHLAAARGGTRSFGKHLISVRPEHSVGEYYFAMTEGSPSEAASYCLKRFYRSVRTKFHLSHPWYIPPKLVGELRGFLWALQLRRRGQKLLSMSCGDIDSHDAITKLQYVDS